MRSAIVAEYDYYHHPYCKLFVVCLLFTGDFLLIPNDYFSTCQNSILIEFYGENAYHTIVSISQQNLVGFMRPFFPRRKQNRSIFFFSMIQHNSTMRNDENEVSSTTTIDMLKDCSPCMNKLIKTSDKHAKFLLENLNLLRKQKELCDVILIIGQSKLAAHRAVLSGKILFTLSIASSFFII